MSNKKKTLTRAEEKQARIDNLKALEAQKKQNDILLARYMKDPNHKMPSNRREFCEAGLLSMTGWILAPTVTQLVGMLEAKAAECPVVNLATGPAPFIHLHYSGGFQTLAAITPYSTAGQDIADYSRLGLGQTPTFQTRFTTSARMFDNGAGRGFFQGLTTAAQATTLANAACVTVPYTDNGDGQQPFSGLGLVQAAGRAGDKLGMLGDADDATGVGEQPAFNISATTPLRVQSLNTILQAVQFAGALAQLNTQQQLSLANTIKGLNDSQARSLTGLGGGENITNLVECAVDQNIKNISGGGQALDPQQVAGMGAIWNNFQNDNVANANGNDVNNLILSAMTMNVLNGNAAGAAYEIGGYDIHNDAGNGRANQEGGAFKIGLTVGRILETARLLNRKVFVQISTNGSNNNAGGTVNDAYNSDSSSYSGSHFIAYDPARPVLPAKAVAPAQIGGLSATGATDRTVFTNVVENGIAAMFYNYCLFSGNEALFERVLPGRFTAAQKAIMRAIAV